MTTVVVTKELDSNQSYCVNTFTEAIALCGIMNHPAVLIEEQSDSTWVNITSDFTTAYTISDSHHVTGSFLIHFSGPR